MMRAPLEVADVFRDGEAGFRSKCGQTLCREQRQVLRAVIRCRTAELGGHVQKCADCGHQRIQYNSCRNRHCPKCQAMARAIRTVFPQTQVQLCLVHLVRNALRYVSFKDRKAVAGDLKLIYRAATLDEAEQALARAGGADGNKGEEAALAAIEMARLLPLLDAPPGAGGSRGRGTSSKRSRSGGSRGRRKSGIAP